MTKKTKTFLPPEYLSRKLSPKIKGLMDAMVSEIKRNIGNQYAIESIYARYSRLFDLEGVTAASEIISEVERSLNRAFHAQGLMIKYLPQDRVREISKDISSSYSVIPDSMKEKAESLMADYVLGRIDYDTISKMLTSVSKGHRNFSKNRSLDIIRKTYSTMLKDKAIAVGVEEFQWIHTASPNPRKLHVEHDKKVFRFDDPPVIYTSHGVEVHGLPGAAIFCRCKIKILIN